MEFKHDVEASYSTRRAAEKLSSDHNIGKVAHTASKIYNASGSGYKAKSSRDYVRGAIDAKQVKRHSDEISNNKNAAKAARGIGGVAHDKNRYMRDANHASNRGATINNMKRESYDPVYEDLCRMGIID